MAAGGEISIQLNGDRQTVPAAITLPGLLERLGLPGSSVLVEHNGTALLRDEWPAVRLADGDRLEILRVVAGG